MRGGVIAEAEQPGLEGFLHGLLDLEPPVGFIGSWVLEQNRSLEVAAGNSQ